MLSRYRKIFFDLDGTLSDSYKGIGNGIRYALNQTGAEGLTESTIKSMIGIPLQESLKQIYGQNEEKFNRTVSYFREYYAEKGLIESELYPGIFNLLEELSAITDLYVVTAKPTPYAIKLLEHHKAVHFFKAVLGCSLNSSTFSKSEIIKQQNGCEHSIMVGDKCQDIEAGKEAGVQSCGVLYGYGKEDEITRSAPDHIIRTVAELRRLLTS